MKHLTNKSALRILIKVSAPVTQIWFRFAVYPLI